MGFDYEKTTEICLKEMFKRVGEKYPNPELTNQKDWYTKRTWTKKEEDAYRDWMRKLLKKRHRHLTAKSLDKEIGMFLLMWGWKNKE